MKKRLLFFILPGIFLISGCTTMILNDHIDRVHVKGKPQTTDIIVGFIKEKESGKWLLAGKKSNYPVDAISGPLANAMNNPEFDKRYLNAAKNSITIFYNQGYGANLFYDTGSFDEQQLKKVQTFAPDIQKGQNIGVLDLSFFISGDDVIAKKDNDQIEYIDKPFIFEIREKGTAYSKALYPLSVAADIVTAPLQLLALPFVIPQLHQ